MALVAADRVSASRNRAVRTFLQQGTAGLLLLLYLTATRLDEPGHIIAALGPTAPILIGVLFLFAITLALLKFPLTEQIFVSFLMTAVFAIFPLLGCVMSSWIAVLAAIVARLFGMRQLGPVKIDMSDSRLELFRTFGLFATYGIPVSLATILYERLGGDVPLLHPSMMAVARITICVIVLMLLNSIVTGRVERAYGYSLSASARLAIVDSSTYFITLPYALLTTLSFGSIGWGAVLAATFSGALANAMVRKLAVTRNDKEQLVQRLASLTNIGKTISISYSTDELLMSIYEECRKVIDVSTFGITLLDETTNELSSVLRIDAGEILPKFRVPAGTGLTSWVVTERKPLLLASSAAERRIGLTSYDDGLPTESWLGVPMIARDRVIGAISVQSYRRNAFSQDDLVLLTSIGNQAAVAIDNGNLYRELEGLNQELEWRVEERMIELRETNLRLLAADRSKNQFLANMSHELRTPLNSIIGFSSVLLDATREVLQPRLYRFLENVKTAGTHLLDLINDILDLSKIESGKLQLNIQEFELRETIGTVERVMKGIAAETQVSLVTTMTPNTMMVHLDQARIKQVMLNLLSNAVKFSHPGQIVHVDVRGIPAADSIIRRDSLRIDVRDHGFGIPQDELQKIFEEFYQVHDSIIPRRGGTGLGLPLTKSFVELHHGAITVESTVGEGSVFSIQLPVDCRGLEPNLTGGRAPGMVRHS